MRGGQRASYNKEASWEEKLDGRTLFYKTTSLMQSSPEQKVNLLLSVFSNVPDVPPYQLPYGSSSLSSFCVVSRFAIFYLFVF